VLSLTDHSIETHQQIIISTFSLFFLSLSSVNEKMMINFFFLLFVGLSTNTTIIGKGNHI
jgi:hypothetical protein